MYYGKRFEVICKARTQKSEREIKYLVKKYSDTFLYNNLDEKHLGIFISNNGVIEIYSKDWLLQWRLDDIINFLVEIVDDGYVDVLVSSNMFWGYDEYRITDKKVLNRNLDMLLFDE